MIPKIVRKYLLRAISSVHAMSTASSRMPTTRRWTLIPALAIIYFAAGKLGLHFASIHSSASAVWPPTGIALAAFLLFGYRVWPAILIGAFFVNDTTAGSALTSLGIALGNTGEGLVGAYLVNRFAGRLAVFEKAHHIFTFAALAALLSTTVSATIGVTSLAIGGYAPWNNFGAIWLTWWLGDAAGALIVAPLLILWSVNPRITWRGVRLVEAIGMLLTVVAVGFLTFAGPVLGNYPLVFLCLPPLAWAAFRFGQREVATALCALTLIATWATESGFGPFVMPTHNESLLVLQAFMGTIAMMTLPIAALVWDRKRADAEREVLRATAEHERAEAEAANRSKDEFLAMLSHELRNPLGAIMMAAGFLQQTSHAEDEIEGAGRTLDIILRQTRHLTKLVDDLLDVSRITRGKVTLRKEPLDMTAVVARAVESSRPLVESRHHRLEVISSDVPVWIEGDATRLTQVILNVLNNAAKYTAPGGRIHVVLTVETGDAVVRVRDTGIGIAPDLLTKIFQPFTQGARGMDRTEGGLGIGLTLVRQLTQMHGGSVEAFSAGLGHGSMFVIRFPLLVTATPAGAATQGERNQHPGAPRRITPRRILVVDDNRDTVESVVTLLQSRGHEVRTAYDGPTALTMAADYQPEVTFLDIGLPEMNGYEVAQRLRGMAGLEQMSLIAMTGYGRDEDRHRTHDAGFDYHLVKPVPIEAVEELLARPPQRPTPSQSPTIPQP